MSSLKFTLRSWPVIALLTIGLCYLTQLVAGWCGITLSDQQNVMIVRRIMTQAFDSLQAFLVAAFLLGQVIFLMPALEELYFRKFLYRRNLLPLQKKHMAFALIPTGAILLIGFLLAFGPKVQQSVLSEFPCCPWICYGLGFAVLAVVEYVLRVFLGRLIAKISPLAIIVVSAVFFSSAHYLSQPFPDNAFLALFFFGLAQCWLYRKTGRLWCAMLNHALFNLTNLVLLFVIPETA